MELRQYFKELGWNEKDLEKPPFHNQKLMSLFHRFGDAQDSLVKQGKDFGFDFSWEDYVNFIQPILKKIDDITPLN